MGLNFFQIPVMSGYVIMTSSSFRHVFSVYFPSSKIAVTSTCIIKKGPEMNSEGVLASFEVSHDYICQEQKFGVYMDRIWR